MASYRPRTSAEWKADLKKEKAAYEAKQDSIKKVKEAPAKAAKAKADAAKKGKFEQYKGSDKPKEVKGLPTRSFKSKSKEYDITERAKKRAKDAKAQTKVKPKTVKKKK